MCLARTLNGCSSPEARLPPEEVVRYATQVALGLAHAHERGVIHRDIKPSNLLLGDDGRLRILDLGLGTLMDDRDPDRGSVATCDGMAIGTADYMSPEQAVGRNAPDGRSDLYSLGCVMYYLLTGRVPFPGDSQIECIASRIKGRPTSLGELRPGLPPGLVGVVDRLMANRRDDRYPSAAEAAEALQALGECERSLSERGAYQAEHAGTASLGSVDSEASLPNELSTTDATNIGYGSAVLVAEPPVVPVGVVAAVRTADPLGGLAGRLGGPAGRFRRGFGHSRVAPSQPGTDHPGLPTLRPRPVPQPPAPPRPLRRHTTNPCLA